MKELLRDVGITRHNTRYINSSDMQKMVNPEDQIFEGDKQFKYFANTRFTMLDMTDYETDFASYKEIPKFYADTGKLPEGYVTKWAKTDSMIEVADMERLPQNSTHRTHKEMLEARDAEPEEEEEEEEDEDEDEDEDEEGGEGEDEEGDEPEEEDEEEEEEDELAVPDEVVQAPPKEDRFFKHDETLKDKYNDVELDNFMKLLNVKPIPQWQDDSTHHYKVGIRAYEDEAQELDPYYHLLAEVERKHFERLQALEFRRGTEVKIVLDQKKMPVYGRF